MNKISTTLEQSQKLIELGININSADMYWEYDFMDHECILKIMDQHFGDTCIPSWSLSALLDVLPVLKRIGYEKAKPNIHFNVFTNKWVCNSLYYTSNSYDNPIDCVFEMICWLKENKKI